MPKTLEQAARELLDSADLVAMAVNVDHFNVARHNLAHTLAALSAETVSVPRDPDAIVDEYSDEYEWDDGESYHVPSEDERMLLADFGHGLVSILHERGLLKPMLTAHEKERNDGS